MGPFELEEELGRGGSGRVFRARHRATGKLCAVKVLDAGADAESLARFAREVQVLARAGSDGVVPVLESGRDPSGRVFYAMELMPGGSLRERLLRRGPYPWRQAAAIVASLGRTLDRCHRLGMVHRDVKPANVLFDIEDRPRLADFGCARDLAGAALTQSGTSLGTPAYMAPEQLEGQAADPRADVYALGVVLFELVKGERPYAGVTWNELLNSAQSGSRAALSDQGTVPKQLDAIVAKALRARPEARHGSAGQVAQELEALLAREPAPLPTPTTPSATSVSVYRRGSRAGIALLALVAVALPPVVLLLYQSRAHSLAPRVVLDEPGDDVTTHEGEPFKVAGKITGRATSLEVAGVRVEPGEDGSFATTVTLTADSHDLVVVAGGAGGTRYEVRRRLLVEKRGAPAWFSRIPEASRPRLPLPRGLRFGEHEREYVNARDGSVLVYVPAGTFLMGTDRGDASEQPVHEVELSAYFMGKYELTNAQFTAFVHATGYATAAEFLGSDVFDGQTGDFEHRRAASWRRPYGDDQKAIPDEPVVHVGWTDALVYTLWAGLALPTEAQWERAAGWDAETRHACRYSWGDDEPGARKALVGNLADASLKAFSPRFPVFEGYDDGFARLAPVGKFPEGRSPVGAEDMLGNVSEWCMDGAEADFYARSPRKDPCCPPEGHDNRSGRGASWCAPAAKVRVTSRLATPLWFTSDFRGIRVARLATDELK